MNPSEQITKRSDTSFRIKSICLNKEHSRYNNIRRNVKSTLEKMYKELQLTPLHYLKPLKNSAKFKGSTSILQGISRYGLEDIVPHSKIKTHLKIGRAHV
jgi:hypothetical protein